MVLKGVTALPPNSVCCRIGRLAKMPTRLEGEVSDKTVSDHAQAKAALSQLAFLKAGPPAKVVPALKLMANNIGNRPGLVSDTERSMITARADAWLAICHLTEHIESKPGTQSIDELWAVAEAAIKVWMHSAE
jgi:hypothetical protein